MKVDTRPLQEGQSIPFADTLDCAHLDFSGQQVFPEPIALSGTIEKKAGVLTLTGRAECPMSLCCDRCGLSFRRALSLPVSVTLAEGRQADDREDIHLLEDGALDLADVFEPAIVLSVDSKILCREDCKGLCPQCGRDLNQDTCPCVRDTTDPRMAALRALLPPSD